MPKAEGQSASIPKKVMTAGFFLLFVVLTIASVFGKRGLIEIRRAQIINKNLQQQTLELTLLRDHLMRDITELESNPQSVDLKAREKLGLVAADEIVILK